MAFSHLGRAAAVGASVFGIVALVVACDGNHDDWDDDGYGHRHRDDSSHCTNVVPQCHTVCQNVCDSYQCYPQCGQECVNVCAGDDDDDASVVTDGGFIVTSDSGTPTTDAAPPPPVGDAGTGVLCSPCIANADCESGALCILRGGTPDASGANGFCSTACSAQTDCPTNFVCTQIGSSRQCVPTGNACQ